MSNDKPSNAFALATIFSVMCLLITVACYEQAPSTGTVIAVAAEVIIVIVCGFFWLVTLTTNPAAEEETDNKYGGIQ